MHMTHILGGKLNEEQQSSGSCISSTENNVFVEKCWTPPQTKQTKGVLGFQGQETGRMCSWEETDGVRFMYGFCCCHLQSTAVSFILSVDRKEVDRVGPCFL